jgi:hypothetical protein
LEDSDNSFADYVIADAERVADLLGITLKENPVKLMSGQTRYKKAIYWSGFSSQGDGACFVGRYQFRKGGLKAIRSEFPADKELDAIAVGLYKIQRRYNWLVAYDITQSGHYSHAHTMHFESIGARDLSGDVCTLLRDFANWIYRRLEAEYNYRMSDESIDESIRANDYEFSVEGKRCICL